MKLVSWNVNGIRACLQKGFLDSFHQLDADIFCVQETKMQSGQADLEIEGYHLSLIHIYRNYSTGLWKGQK